MSTEHTEPSTPPQQIVVPSFSVSAAISSFLNSTLGQTLGVSVIFIGLFYLTWVQMNKHIDGRIDAMDKRIEQLAAQVQFDQEYMLSEQQQRQVLFQAIEQHLAEISRGYHVRPRGDE